MQHVARAGLEPRTVRLRVRRADHWPRLRKPTFNLNVVIFSFNLGAHHYSELADQSTSHAQSNRVKNFVQPGQFIHPDQVWHAVMGF